MPVLALAALAVIISPSQKAGIVAGLVVAANIISGTVGFLATLFPIAMGFLVLGFAAALYRRNIVLRRVSPWLNAFSLVFLAVVILAATPQMIGGHRQAEADSTAPLVQWEKVSYKPDIYYIIPDGYTNREGMAVAYGIDNSQAYRDLEALGYRAMPESQSNYPLTMLTLGSALNFDYTLLPGQSEHIRNLKVRLNNPQVIQELQRGGYHYVHAGGNWLLHGQQADTQLFAQPGFSMTSFHHTLMAETIVPLLIGLIGGEYGYYHVLHENNLKVVDNIARAVQLETDQPKLVVAHLLLPHDPFYLDANCDFDPLSTYGQQALCVNRLLRDVVGQIPPEAVVIIQGDHGAWAAHLSYETPTARGAATPFMLTDEQIVRTRLGNFAAYRHLEAYPGMTPVNTWRVLFNQYFGADLELLPDRHYLIPGYNNPMEVYPVLE
jgi:hypothetical protein